MTTSVTQCEAMLNQILNERANVLAKETGFVKRERKLTGATFVQVMALGHLHQPEASLEQLTQGAHICGVQISASGLHQRCTQAAATFLQAVLWELVQQVVTVKAVPVAMFKRFKHVILEDASTIVLPEELADLWPGCGGGSATTTAHTASALKLHVRLDLKHGWLLGPYLSAGRVHELHGPLREQIVSAGSLYVADRGYWSLARLRELSEQGVRFCLHPKANTVFYDRQGHRIDLETALPRTCGQIKILYVSLGKQEPLPVRLIMMRVPPEVAEQRREHLKKEATDKGKIVSEVQWKLAEWTLIVTNTSARQISAEQALILLRQRWLIELLFKLWKSHGHLDTWRSALPWQALCELYAKLIAVVIQHWLLLFGCWHDPWRSLFKAAAVVRALALDLLEVLSGTRHLHQVIRKGRAMMQSGCRVHRRVAEPCLAQILLEGLDWVLT
ncbi:hypothetical protein KDH_21550 [Dictyobacter sp. S3.2.2.5]|uniref:Transposase IS4-like domain-containing protein n=1 Tax=Dictyobacter halimunensis TaxID=3026934 RepID=A0ABQ6FMC7_9CHLR|nr:hypothetical protein KDH_17040 [Dictyobacter sp. S3.2.2.5]GLV54907.1 hypothetical protein KDH_17540 [Dictyobacter sp. S3.2.2.5]GLV55308.1 hypothetical protein KDH_21550 [Dictyobacter sp. S3.2.2.5]